MKITDFVAALNLRLVVHFGINQCGPWIAKIQSGSDGGYVGYKINWEDKLLRSAAGYGESPETAIFDLVKKVNEYKVISIEGVKGGPTKLTLTELTA